MMDALSLVMDTLVELTTKFVRHLPLLAAGLLVILLFNWLAKVLQGSVRRVADRSGLDIALASIFASLTGIVARIIGVLVACVVVIPSFEPGSLIAGLGLSSVAIGFAFKDILQNFVAGILILWNKPFAVGDVIETGGHLGTVDLINVRSTYIRTFDGKQVIIPNGDVFESDVKVFSAYPNQRIAISVGIGYGDSIDQAQEVMLEAVRSVEGVLVDPEPTAYLTGLG
ncbi:MAG: mechanosensitive ion channel family protein [Candidatus Obscuribacterales bacterium]